MNAGSHFGKSDPILRYFNKFNPANVLYSSTKKFFCSTTAFFPRLGLLSLVEARYFCLFCICVFIFYPGDSQHSLTIQGLPGTRFRNCIVYYHRYFLENWSSFFVAASGTTNYYLQTVYHCLVPSLWEMISCRLWHSNSIGAAQYHVLFSWSAGGYLFIPYSYIAVIGTDRVGGEDSPIQDCFPRWTKEPIPSSARLAHGS